MKLAPIWESEATRVTQREIWGGDCPQCWTACEAYQSILGNLMWRKTNPTDLTLRQPRAVR